MDLGWDLGLSFKPKQGNRLCKTTTNVQVVSLYILTLPLLFNLAITAGEANTKAIRSL